MITPFSICAAITAVSASISLGFSIAATVQARGEARGLSLYCCARSLALFLVAVVPFGSGSVPWLEAAATAMVVVQGCDTIVGVLARDVVKTVGPAAVAILNAAALAWMSV